MTSQGGGALEQEPDAGAEPGHRVRAHFAEQSAPHGGHFHHGHRHDVPEPDHRHHDQRLPPLLLIRSVRRFLLRSLDSCSRGS